MHKAPAFIQSSPTGEFSLRAHNPLEPEKSYQIEGFINEITYAGMGALYGRPGINSINSLIERVCVGTGTLADYKSATTLSSPHAETPHRILQTLTESEEQDNISWPNHKYRTLTTVFRFEVDAITQPITEIGILCNTVDVLTNFTDKGDRLIAGALIRDSGGSPTSITMPAGHALEVTYKFRFLDIRGNRPLHVPYSDSYWRYTELSTGQVIVRDEGDNEIRQLQYQVGRLTGTSYGHGPSGNNDGLERSPFLYLYSPVLSNKPYIKITHDDGGFITADDGVDVPGLTRTISPEAFLYDDANSNRFLIVRWNVQITLDSQYNSGLDTLITKVQAGCNDLVDLSPALFFTMTGLPNNIHKTGSRKLIMNLYADQIMQARS